MELVSSLVPDFLLGNLVPNCGKGKVAGKSEKRVAWIRMGVRMHLEDYSQASACEYLSGSHRNIPTPNVRNTWATDPREWMTAWDLWEY